MKTLVELGPDHGLGRVLVCPGCGGEYLHQSTVTAFNRGEDDKTTRTTSVGVTGIADHLLPNVTCGNPSARRNGASVTFTCENCHEPGDGDSPPRFSLPLELTIAQHKGMSYLQWRLAKA